jgi:hypothetical protein
VVTRPASAEQTRAALRLSPPISSDVENHFYSVPYRFARAEVEAHLTASTIEVFHMGERIAAHECACFTA